MSFDAPRLHHGLGNDQSAERLRIRWPTGEETELEGPFEAGNRYRVTLER